MRSGSCYSKYKNHYLKSTLLECSAICLASLFIFTDTFDEHSSGPAAFEAPDVAWLWLWKCPSDLLLPHLNSARLKLWKSFLAFRFSDTFDHWSWVQIRDFQTRINGTGISSEVNISRPTGQKRMNKSDLISAAYLECFQFFNKTVQWRKMLAALMQTMNHCRNCWVWPDLYKPPDWHSSRSLVTLDKEPNHVSAVVGLGVFFVALLSKAAEPPPIPRLSDVGSISWWDGHKKSSRAALMKVQPVVPPGPVYPTESHWPPYIHTAESKDMWRVLYASFISSIPSATRNPIAPLVAKGGK